MTKFLMKFSSNWADEMDIYGFTVMDEGEKQSYLEAVENAEYPLTWEAGTNEEIEWPDSSDLLMDITFEEISETAAKTLKRLFSDRPGCSWGHYPDIDEIYPEDDIEDDDDDEE